MLPFFDAQVAAGKEEKCSETCCMIPAFMPKDTKVRLTEHWITKQLCILEKMVCILDVVR